MTSKRKRIFGLKRGARVLKTAGEKAAHARRHIIIEYRLRQQAAWLRPRPAISVHEGLRRKLFAILWLALTAACRCLIASVASTGAKHDSRLSSKPLDSSRHHGAHNSEAGRLGSNAISCQNAAHENHLAR